MTLRDVWQRVRRLYAHRGAESVVGSLVEKRWLQARLEGPEGEPHYPDGTRKRILEQLTASRRT